MSFFLRTHFPTFLRRTKPKDVLENKRIVSKRKNFIYTSWGERQTMLVLHNLGKSTKEIASSLAVRNRITTFLLVFVLMTTDLCFKPKTSQKTPQKCAQLICKKKKRMEHLVSVGHLNLLT
jgi:phosphohistidine phosphatase SixA